MLILLTCHAFHDVPEVRFAILRVLSRGALQYALYVAEAQTARAHVPRHAAVRVIVVLDVDRLRLLVILAAVKRRCRAVFHHRRRFQIARQHYTQQRQQQYFILARRRL